MLLLPLSLQYHTRVVKSKLYMIDRRWTGQMDELQPLRNGESTSPRNIHGRCHSDLKCIPSFKKNKQQSYNSSLIKINRKGTLLPCIIHAGPTYERTIIVNTL